MGKLILDITTSLDGYVAGPNQTLEEPLGKGGESLHEWVVKLAAWRESHGLEGGETNADSEVVGSRLHGLQPTTGASDEIECLRRSFLHTVPKGRRDGTTDPRYLDVARRLRRRAEPDARGTARQAANGSTTGCSGSPAGERRTAS